MCAGEFVHVYGRGEQRGAWDAVVTCYFLDTAPNVVEYVELIHKLLRPGGVWVNVGADRACAQPVAARARAEPPLPCPRTAAVPLALHRRRPRGHG